MKIEVVPVILSGGSGTRLWPLSRTGFPKQFLVFDKNNSLFQSALLRVASIGSDELQVMTSIVVTNEEHRFLVLNQLREIGVTDAKLVLEPEGRNTAPALTLAALEAKTDGLDPVLIVSPADQIVQDSGAFNEALHVAVKAAADGKIVVLGIQPTRPESGYGYIRFSEEGTEGFHGVREFAEKPDVETAERYLDSGEYLWNAGIYVVRASVWLGALAKHRNDVLTATIRSWEVSQRESCLIRPSKKLFENVPADSIDYAVSERCPGTEFELAVVPLGSAWSDLGAWDAVWDAAVRNNDGNAVYGNAIVQETTNSYIRADKRLVAVLGLDDIVVVDTPDAVLITHKSRTQGVKNIVAELRAKDSAESNAHRKVHRPWGWYDEIDTEERFKVKRICLSPGEGISLQMHHHRAEHWIVVKGTARVTCGERVFLMTENQSTFIPLGEIHRLENPGMIPLEIIEVQSGTYLGEDDIVRLKDDYGRQERNVS